MHTQKPNFRETSQSMLIESKVLFFFGHFSKLSTHLWCTIVSLPETNTVPSNGRLENSFPFGARPIFQV